MRIVYAITRSDTVGGAHIHVRDLANHLIDGGHQVTVLTGGVGAFTKELEQRHIPFRSLRFLGRQINLREDARGLLELRTVLKELQPDLLSTHSSKAGWLGRVAARTLGIPVIFTAHGWAFTEGVPTSSAALYRVAEICAGRLADRIINVSEHDRQLAHRAHIAPSRRLVTVHNGMLDIPATLRATPDREPRGWS